MGIDSGWKNSILPSKFPTAFLEENPDAHYIIDDFSLAFRSKLFYGISNWNEVRTRIFNRLTGIKRPNLLQKYVILFDESEFVPLAKRPVQLERRRDPKYKGKPIFPFSETEKAEFRIGIDSMPKTNTAFGEYVARMWISGKEIMHQIIFFVQNEIVHHYLAHKPPFEIVIDGCRSDQSNNNLHPESGIKINDLRQNCNSAQVLHLTRSEGNALATITGSFGIGESDVKIARHVSLLPEGKVVIFGDSDTVPIILLNSRRWILENTGYLKHHIYLGTDSAKKKKGKDVIDLTELWRSIQKSIPDKFGRIIFPVEALVCLMLLSGSDYTQKLLKQFGPVKIWNAFEHGGHKLFSDEGAVQSSEEYGLDTIEHNYQMNFLNHKIYDFIFYIYKSKFGVALNMNSVRRMANVEDRKKKTSKSKYEIASDDELYSNIRRMWWTFEYWANGITDIPFPDPIALHDESGLSTHGWIKTIAGDIKVAPKVHTFSKPQE